MKKKALYKDLAVEIKRSFNRFISIFLIVAMGTAFLSGIRAAEPDMRLSADQFYDEHELMNLRVMGTMGLTEVDVNVLRQLEGVAKVEPGYSADLLSDFEGNQQVLKIISNLPTMNTPDVIEGRMPTGIGEALLDVRYAEAKGYKLGDSIHMKSASDEDLADTLVTDTYEIVGIGSSPSYISLHTGNTTIGDGELDGFLIVDEANFSMDVYSQIDLQVKGTEELVAYTTEYDLAIAPIVKELEDRVGKERGQARYDEVIVEADVELAKAERELAEQKQDAEQKLADAQAKLEDSEQTLSSEGAKLTSGRAELERGQQQVADNQAKLERESAKLLEGESQLSKGKASYEANVKQLASTKQQLQAGEVKLAEGKSALAAGRAQYESGAVQLNTAKEQLRQLKQSIKEMTAKGLTPTEEMLGQAAALEAGVKEQSTKLAAALKQLQSNEAELQAKEAELAQGKQQLASAEAKLKAAKQTLEQSEAGLVSGRQQLAAGQTKLQSAQVELAVNERKLADGEAALLEGRQELDEGWSTFKKEQMDANQKIKDAEGELADARAELKDMKIPEWIIMDRDDMPNYSEYGDNAERIRAIGNVFPVLFFLVAALISLTTITRMVEEERVQIGTLKALGYGKLSIANKYILYALLATLGGSIVGVLVGQKVLPFIIINAYKMMYPYLPNIVIPYHLSYGAYAAAAAVACTLLAAVLASYKELLAQPAVLMRPEPPKQGKRIFMEYLPLIWKRLNFTQKATLRNLIRYKKRFFMTVFGIGGCMALMVVGFGIRDSIFDVARIQYDELQLYNGAVMLDAKASPQEVTQLEDFISGDERIHDHTTVYMTSMDVSTTGEGINAYMVVPERMDTFDNYFVLRDRHSQERYTLDESGMIINEKLAKLLDVSAGDTVTLHQDQKSYEVKVSYITENYMGHYMYMLPQLYEQIYGKAPVHNSILFQSVAGDEEIDKAFGQDAISYDAALSVTYLDQVKQQIDDMLSSLDIVIVVLIISAGMLAFVVLYNLNNININERKRELASLKVLGFYDMEVASYVYRENVLLTLIGAGLGVLLGKLLHGFVIVTVEIENTMFGRDIYFSSYLYSILFTIAFSLFVNWTMYYKLKKIDMVESLKSVE